MKHQSALAQARAKSKPYLFAAACGYSALALAGASATPDEALSFINANAVTTTASVECRFIFEYAWNDSAAADAEAGTGVHRTDRAATFSGSLSDGGLVLSADRRSISGLGLAFDYDLMTDSGHGRMAHEAGSSNAERTIALKDIAPASLRISDVTPQDKSVALNWLRSSLPPTSFSSLDRIDAENKSQGWNLQQSAGACTLGNSKILEVQWRNRHGEPITAYVLWPPGSAEFEHALRTLVGSSRKSRD
jgi:hypothetical protein